MTDTQTFRRLADAPAFAGDDGVLVHELGGHSSGLASHSLAFITHPAGTAARTHHHLLADEIYFVSAGHGRLLVDGAVRTLVAGDIAQIRPGQRHKVWSDGPEPLELIVTCAPAHSREDVIWDEDE